MAKKLYDLKISEISLVDHPANKRKFLVVKCVNAEAEEVQPMFFATPMSKAEALEAVSKAGGYERYRQSVLSDVLSAAEVEPLEKTASRIEMAAKSMGGLEQYFRLNPDEFERYRQASYANPQQERD